MPGLRRHVGTGHFDKLSAGSDLAAGLGVSAFTVLLNDEDRVALCQQVVAEYGEGLELISSRFYTCTCRPRNR